MGREWLYWVGGGRRRRRSHIKQQQQQEEENSSAGCMCSVFQLFDLHQFQLPLNHLHLQQPPSSFKEVEAPRNSLDLEETEAMKAASNPSPINKQQQQQQDLNLPVGINQIKTRGGCSKSTTEDLDSPGTKTPSLVARLMGLDLLPESSSPSLNPIKRCFSDDDISVGARSLPETSRTSDVDHHHRLSLQINKDRTNDEFVGKRVTRFRIKEDENSSHSPGHYARQIVNQVKESVTRRVGLLDITNTHRRDQNLLHKKTPKLDTQITPDFKQSTTSQKLRLLDARKCTSVTDTGVKSPRNSSSSESCWSSSKPKHQVIIQNDCRKAEIGKMKKLSTQKFDKGKEEAFVRSKSKKKSPLSSELSLPIKKDPSPPATKLPLKQQQQQDQESSADSVSSKRKTQLSCNTSHSYRQQQLHNVVPPDNANGYATTAAPDYKSYVNKILKRAGIVDTFTPLTLGKWHTPSHPLDPSIFYYLELFNPATAAALSRRSNRKLIFQLVDELLVDILRPRLDFRNRIINNDHFGLDDELCKRIGSFPAAKCRVLEDIDRLVDNDLCESPLSRCYQEEQERLVCEIEGEIVEWLVRETVGLVVGVRTCHVIRCH